VGLPSKVVTEAPRGLPSAPHKVELALVAGTTDKLKIYWVHPVITNGRPVLQYEVQWSNSSSFESLLGSEVAQPLDSIFETKRTIPNMQEYTAGGLKMGEKYYFRVRAINSEGAGPWESSIPQFERPRMQPTAIPYGDVTLRPVLADATTTVADSVSSLELTWTAPKDSRGSPLSLYRIEYWKLAGRNEVQTLRIEGAIGGTFSLSWRDDVSDAIPYEVSSLQLKAHIEAFNELTEVEVERIVSTDPFGSGDEIITFHITFTGEVADMVHSFMADAKGLVTSPTRLANNGPTYFATAKVQRGFNGNANQMINDIAGCPGEWSMSIGSAEIKCTDPLLDVRLPVGSWVELRLNPMTPAISTIRRVVESAFGVSGTSLLLSSPLERTPGVLNTTQLTLLSGTSVIGAEPIGITEVTFDPESLYQGSASISPTGSTNSRSIMRYVITGLEPNVPYFARVSSRNDMGFSAAQGSVPRSLATPRQKPDPPARVTLHAQSSAALQVSFYAPDSDGGDSVSKYVAEWDTKPSFDSTPGGQALGYQELHISSSTLVDNKPPCTTAPCSIVIGGLQQGTQYYVRVFSHNSFGFCARAALPYPISAIPRTFAAPPAYVSVLADGENSLRVEFPATSNDGGAEVVKYKVEWDILGANAITLGKSPSPVLYSLSSVREVEVSTPAAPGPVGTFSLSFEGFSTRPLNVDISADELSSALTSLHTIGSVAVDRRRLEGPDSWGFAWRVTFIGNPGNTSKLLCSSNGEVYQSVMSGAASMGLLEPGNARVMVTELVTGLLGFETQEVTIDSSGVSGVSGSGSVTPSTNLGGFTLSFEGRSTSVLKADVTPETLKSALEALGNTGELLVTRKRTASQLGFTWTIVFLTRLSNLASLIATPSGLAPDFTIKVTEVSAGDLPAFDSTLKGSAEVSGENKTSTGVFAYTIGGLIRGASYHVRVSAWNGVNGGFGGAQYSTPASATVVPSPSAPSAVEVLVSGSTSLDVSFLPPHNLLAREVAKYRVDWDTNTGRAEQQLIRLSSSLTSSSTSSRF